MDKQNISLTSAEWTVMECLWERSPLTGREVTELMHVRCGWSRSTTLTFLSRMEAKKAICSNADSGVKCFFPLIKREDAAQQETENFLGRVYKGSVSLMVSSLTKRQALSQEEIDELYAMLREIEEGKSHD